MEKKYIIVYANENEFHKKERALKKYNMFAYKKLIFEHYPALREGTFNGVLISTNEKDKTEKYELVLPTDNIFKKVHGTIALHYTVCQEKKTVTLETLTPEEILTEIFYEQHQKELNTYKGVMVFKSHKELDTYKGVMVSKSHEELDMFKINLLKSMNRNNQ